MIELLGPEPRPGLRDVAPYDSPQLDVVAKLNTNESPHSLPVAFFDELAQAVRELPLHRYPDGGMMELRRELGRATGHDPDGIWVANGSNEVLTQLLLAYGGPDRRALTFQPTYLLHSRLAWLTNTQMVSIDLQPPWELRSEHVERALEAKADVVFVCSPNNPTGNAQPVARIEDLAAGRPSALVLVDEAYGEFGGNSALPLVATHPNVVVVRTFSKAFALAGARIGYVLAAPPVVEILQRVRLPYHVSQLTQTAGLVALRHRTEAMRILEGIRAQRDRIVLELGAMGVPVHPSDANFVLFEPPGRTVEIWQGLLDRGVLVRDMSSVVPNALRVTAGSRSEVDLFLAALKEVLSG